MVHDMFPNRTFGILICQPNVTLALTSKTKVSPDDVMPHSQGSR